MAPTSTVLHCIAVPFMMLFSLPLIVLSCFTTGAAMLLLAFRVGLVYLELGFAIISNLFTNPPKTPEISESLWKRYSNAGEGWKTPNYDNGPYQGDFSGYATPAPGSLVPTYWSPGSGYTSPLRRRSSYFATSVPRRSSHRRLSSSQVSLRSIGPIQEDEVMTEVIPVSGDAYFAPSLGLDRDFEGLGGYRIDTGDEADNRAWTTMNSRLQLRSPRSPLSAGSYGGSLSSSNSNSNNRPSYPLLHQRSHSLGPVIAPAERVYLAMVYEQETAAREAAAQEQLQQPPQANSSRIRVRRRSMRAPPSISLPGREAKEWFS
ncbi:hypothetical protein VTK26DRAFT_4726 [Humicola hyalothermophila]